MTAATAKIQIGTDKTAAELALVRLRDELKTLENERRHHTDAAEPVIAEERHTLGGVFWISGFLAWLVGSALCRSLFGDTYTLVGIPIGILVGLIFRTLSKTKEEDRLKKVLAKIYDPLRLKTFPLTQRSSRIGQ